MFSLINCETKEAFNFLFQATKEIRADYSIPEPLTVVMDQCTEIK